MNFIPEGPMNFKPLTLADRPIFKAAEKAAIQLIGDTSFTNLFIWRPYYRPRWVEAHGCLCLLALPEGEEPFGLVPVGPGDRIAALGHTCQALAELTKHPQIRRVPEDLVTELEAAGAPYEYSHDRNHDDYVYLKESLSTLSGRKMHQKRNHYNYFINHNQFECVPVTSELISELLAVQEGWLANKEEQSHTTGLLNYELTSVQELLHHMDDLNQMGLAIRINGRIEGFTMGEMLNPNTMLVHLEKANSEIRGLFMALFSHFCHLFSPEVVYVNREQDLGLPGLRLSKESLRPDHMVRKFTVIPKNSALLG